jgi:hypothetical protein
VTLKEDFGRTSRNSDFSRASKLHLPVTYGLSLSKHCTLLLKHTRETYITKDEIFHKLCTVVCMLGSQPATTFCLPSYPRTDTDAFAFGVPSLSLSLSLCPSHMCACVGGRGMHVRSIKRPAIYHFHFKETVIPKDSGMDLK